MTIKQLQAKVKAAQKANSQKIADAAIIASLEASLKLESSKSLFNSKVKLAASGYNTKILQDLIAECSAIVDTMPIQNPKTRTLRKWNGSKRFTFGPQINLMYQLASGIMYSCQDHKDMILEHTGLNAEMLEQFVESFGTPSYYSRNHHTIVEATPYDVEGVVGAVAVMQSSLGVVVDTAQLTEANFSLEFGKAQIKAHNDKLLADEAVAELEMPL